MMGFAEAFRCYVPKQSGTSQTEDRHPLQAVAKGAFRLGFPNLGFREVFSIPYDDDNNNYNNNCYYISRDTIDPKLDSYPTYSLHCRSFWGSLFRIHNIDIG